MGWKRKKKNPDEMSDAEFLDFAFEEEKRKLKQSRRKLFLKECIVGICMLCWILFCVQGVIGIVGMDHPYITGMLGTAVFVAGILLANPIISRWLNCPSSEYLGQRGLIN